MGRRAHSALVSGAGIAGCCLAYWLSRAGFAVTLVERAPRLRTGGYVIDFWGAGYDVAGAMGVLPDLRDAGYRVKEVRFVDGAGRRAGGFGADVFQALTDGKFLSLQRGDLAKALFGALSNPCTVVFGDSVTALAEDGEGVGVSFERAADSRFDLVIGADGLHSQVRNLAFGPQARFERFLGYRVAAFESAGYRPRDELAYVSYATPGKSVSRFAMRGDRTMFLFVFASESGDGSSLGDADAQKALLRDTFLGEGWECDRILAELDRCDEIYSDRVSQVCMETWSKGRIALVGDAAFCPSLLAGQGAALAMVAAYVLAGELSRPGGDFAAAFRRYEGLLAAPIRTKQQAARRFAGAFAPRTRLGLAIRNQVTKVMSLPLVAKYALGPSLVDEIALPTYDVAPAFNDGGRTPGAM